MGSPVDRSPHRLIRHEEIEPALTEVGLRPTIRRGVGGHVVRFVAVKHQ